MVLADAQQAADALTEGPEIKAAIDALDQAMAAVVQQTLDAVGLTMAARGVRYPKRVVMYLEEGSREVLDELAAADHLSPGAYLRRLVMAHVERKRRDRGA